MTFGQKYNREDAESTTTYSIWGFKAGENNVRFLEEMEAWTKYYEHYNQEKKAYYPCTGDRSSCPGCTSTDERESQASKRYLANALDLNANEVRLYKVPASLISSLDRRADRDKTITARDFEIFREGKGINTSYDLESGEKEAMNLKKYANQLLDHQEALMQTFVEAWGSEPDDLAEQARPKARRRPRDEEEEQPKRARRPRRQVVEDDEVNDDPPTRSSASKTTPAADKDEVVDEEELRGFSVAQLSQVYEKYSLEFPHDLKKPDGDTTEIVDHLLLALEAKG